MNTDKPTNGLDIEGIGNDIEAVLGKYNLPEELRSQVKAQVVNTIKLKTTDFTFPEQLDEAVGAQHVDPEILQAAASKLNNQTGWPKRLTTILCRGRDITEITNAELLDLAIKLRDHKLLINNIGDGTLRIIALYFKMIIKEGEDLTTPYAPVQLQAPERKNKEDYLLTPINEIGFSVRTLNALNKSSLRKPILLGDIVQMSPEELLKIKGLGRKALDEIYRVLVTLVPGLTLGKQFGNDFNALLERKRRS